MPEIHSCVADLNISRIDKSERWNYTQISKKPISSAMGAGLVYDSTGSYINTFLLLAILLVMASVCMAFASPPEPTVPDQDIALTQ